MKFPANTEIYIDQLRELVELEAISPDNLLKKLNPNLDLEKFIELQKE